MMEHIYNCVEAFSHVDSLINQIVHLSGDGLTTYTEDGRFPGSQKVHGAGLEVVVGVKHLLRRVETSVSMDGVLLDGRCAACGEDAVFSEVRDNR